MKNITSRQNSIFKLCQKLQKKKYRDELSRYLIEGPNLIEEAFRCGIKPDAIIVDEASSALYEELYPDAYVLEHQLFKAISETTTPQGIIAIVEKREPDKQELTERLSATEGNVLILDRLQDPGNIGTIIRTADAAGVEAILLIKGSGDIYSPKVVRAAAGSVFRIPAIIVDGGEAIDMMRRAGRRVYATWLEGARWYYDEDLKKGAAIIIGNEGNGVSLELLEAADARIKIPMKGNIESLNAGVAAAILLYEAMRP